MESHYLPEKQVSYICGIICFMTWNEMCHFTKSIHNHKNRISNPFCPKQPQNKTHRYVYPCDGNQGGRSLKDPLQVPDGPITRSRAKKIKEAMQRLV